MALINNNTGTERLSIQRLAAGEPQPGSSLADDVRAGLSAVPKFLPPKYFYDERGSRLFDLICDTPEYYPTRVEDALLERIASELVARVQPHTIVELGSGTSRKTARLLDACDAQACHCRYQPLDVCREMLHDAGRRLVDTHDWLEVEALVGDYCDGLVALPAPKGVRLFVFLGGTIGNFTEAAAVRFLGNVRAAMGGNDWLLLGADRVKDAAVLNAAYNDGRGYTAAFNLNVLHVINRELNARFDLDTFVHRAFYNADRSRIEMHLESTVAQSVRIDDLAMTVDFRKGETILTEISRKFTEPALVAMLNAAGFGVDRHFTPADHYYSLVLARPRDGS